MDFIQIKNMANPNNRQVDFVLVPSLRLRDTKDLLIRGGAFYAFWNGEKWDTRLNNLWGAIDDELIREKKKHLANDPKAVIQIRYASDADTKIAESFVKSFKILETEQPSFNTRIIFGNETIVKEDYATTKLSYTPKEGDTSAFEELLGTLYDDANLTKLLWGMGATLTNSMKDIQKFLYIYGGKGTGKGTVINIFKDVFEDYAAPIDLHKLTDGSNFGTSDVQEIPLLIDSDSNIGTIRNDTNLLKLTSHESVTVNRKYQAEYDVTFNGLLLTASNQRYKSRNVDAGINRRAIVVEPSGNTVEPHRYNQLMADIETEIPAIAMLAINVFKKLGASAYRDDVNTDMQEATDIMFSFMIENYDKLGDMVTLKRASELYKDFLIDRDLSTEGAKSKLKNELKRYYEHNQDRRMVDGVAQYNLYWGLKHDVLFPSKGKKEPEIQTDNEMGWLNLSKPQVKPFGEYGEKFPAQYANENETPMMKWDNVTTTLADIDETELHYVKVPLNLIVLDFDLRDSDGNKSLERNLMEASKYPETYAETSKSGKGIHLHYLYKGDPTELSSIVSHNIEVKVFKGNSSLRRKLVLWNDKKIAEATQQELHLKKKEDVKKMYDSTEMIWTEQKIRTAIERNLRKEYHSATKPSVDFIDHILKEADANGVQYDVSDLANDVLVFASKSTNNKAYCLALVSKMKFKNVEEEVDGGSVTKEDISGRTYPKEDLYFFDLEVYPNLLLIEYTKYGSGKIEKMFNPKPEEIEKLIAHPLIGFNNRRYDNHILYGAFIGESNLELFHRSQEIISGNRSGFNVNAYDLAYADIYEYNSKKQSLKKWEIEMGMKHDEFEFPWDKPLDESEWDRAAEYCANDVKATEKLFDYTYDDYKAREILSELSGLPINATTQQQAAKFLFGNDKRPQDKFVYTDLSKQFPGYKFDKFGKDEAGRGKSTYRGEVVGEGGYVYSNPGTYKHVVEIDVASMHPTSLIELNYFGPYTQRFADLKQARIYVKHGDFDSAGKMFNGGLKPFLGDKSRAKNLAYAMKIIINIVYGMTSALFDNKFRSPKNIDNIVAKRGALFMIDLKHAAQDKGYKVIHIKTDSIKLADATQDQIDFVVDFGKKYGYNFEVEHIFDRLALLNKAVLVGKVEDNEKWPDHGQWEAIGAEFQDPYIFKTLCTGEPIMNTDFFVTKSVKKGTMYIDDKFVGKVGQFYASKNGGKLLKRIDTDDGKYKEAAVAGTKGVQWKLSTDYTSLDDVDMSYYEQMVTDAVADVDKIGISRDIFGDKCKRYLP